MKIVQLTTDNRENFRDYANPTPWFGAAPEALLQGFAQISGIEVHVLSCVQQPMASPEKLADNIWFHPLPVPKRGWLRTGYQGCVREVRQKLRELKPDIVHGQGTERDCAISAVFSGFPNVVTIHGNMAVMARYQDSCFGALYSRCAALLESIALRRTAGVLCNSAYTESLVARRASRTWRVPNPLRLPFFAPPEVSMIAAPPVLLNVGVVSPRKRQLEILTLGRELHSRGLRFRIHFIGSLDPSGKYGGEFARQVAEAETAGYARYLGNRNGAELMACFDAASALLHLPSEEAFGLVAAEALARNLKLFATGVGGLIEIGAAVPGAELFAPERWDEVLEAVARWLAAGAPRPADAAAEMANRYHPRRVAERHLEIYREVLALRYKIAGE